MIRRLLNWKNSNRVQTQKAAQREPHLNIEALEPRMMLSTVSIYASGQTGEETMQVYAGEVVQTFENVPTEGSVYTIETTRSVVNDLIAIEFTNDLYAPEQGIDRNLSVEKIVVDGQTIFTTDDSVFADGVWDPATGQIVSGNGIGPTLHTNGFFDFFIEGESIDNIDFAGKNWNVVAGVGTSETLSVSEFSDMLTISGANGPVAISTSVDVEPGAIYDLTFTAERSVLEGQFSSDSQPWATVGINYYDSHGSLITQNRVDVNSAGTQGINREYVVPENASSAYAWVWIDGFQSDVNIPLKLSNFSFTPVDISNDTTPPTAEFNSLTFTTTFDNEIGFGVEFGDDTRVPNVSSGTITVTGPNGFNQTPPIVFGSAGQNELSEISVFGMTKPDGSDFTSADNGVYTVTLNENTLVDFAGNFAAGGVLGTITVSITDPVADTTPPVVTLSGVNDVFSPPNDGRGSDIVFYVTYTDDRPVNEAFDNAILVEGPNGYSGFGQGIAGERAEPYGYFEITYIPLPGDGVWSENDNGTYTISLLDDTVVDSSGNATPGRELGSFVVGISDVEVG